MEGKQWTVGRTLRTEGRTLRTEGRELILDIGYRISGRVGREEMGYWENRCQRAGVRSQGRELKSDIHRSTKNEARNSHSGTFQEPHFNSHPLTYSLSIQILQDAADTLALGFGGRGRRRFGVAVAGDQRAEAPLLSRVGAGNGPGRIGFGRLLLTN